MVRESQAELLASHEKLKAQLEGRKAGKGMAAVLLGLADQQRRMAGALKGLTGRRFDVALTDLEVGKSGGSDSEINRKTDSFRES